MNREQSYIEGFVKRASEHGLASNEALELLKEATTFGATRNLLRQMQSQGVKLHRTPLNMAKAVAPKFDLRAPGRYFKQPGSKTLMYEQGIPLTDNQKVKAFTPSIREMPGAYVHESIYVPRKKIKQPIDIPQNDWSNAYTSRMQPAGTDSSRNFVKYPGASPRHILFHEAGHAMHELDDPAYYKLRKGNRQDVGSMMGMHSKKQIETALGSERIANNNAINFMRQNNVPQQNIEKYINDADLNYGTYVSNFKPNFLKNNTYNPGHSVQAY